MLDHELWVQNYNFDMDIIVSSDTVEKRISLNKLYLKKYKKLLFRYLSVNVTIFLRSIINQIVKTAKYVNIFKI